MLGPVYPTPPSMSSAKSKSKLSPAQRADLLARLQRRFEENPGRHRGILWKDVTERLESAPAKISCLAEMDRTGGEPDVVGRDRETGEIIFFDCSAESPEGRTSVCYDRAALDSRKEFKPKTSAVDLATAMGVELLTEAEYRQLQELGSFDLKSSSWVQTPAEIRKLGGALFGDRRFGRVFIYHNGAQSYYSGRGFRASLRV